MEIDVSVTVTPYVPTVIRGQTHTRARTEESLFVMNIWSYDVFGVFCFNAINLTPVEHLTGVRCDALPAPFRTSLNLLLPW